MLVMLAKLILLRHSWNERDKDLKSIICATSKPRHLQMIYDIATGADKWHGWIDRRIRGKSIPPRCAECGRLLTRDIWMTVWDGELELVDLCIYHGPGIRFDSVICKDVELLEPNSVWLWNTLFWLRAYVEFVSMIVKDVMFYLLFRFALFGKEKC